MVALARHGNDRERRRGAAYSATDEPPSGSCDLEMAVPTVTCPICGEDDDLHGERQGDAIMLTCGACGHRWDRDTRLSCRLCGSEDLEGVATSTLEEAGRAGVRTPSGIRLVYYCWSCRGNDVTSSLPRQGPQPPPGRSRDLRALRGR
jgi:hypothetical protein